MKSAERIEIDRRYCKGCMLCQYVCKFDVFEPGEERSVLDYLMPRPAKLENCRVCRLCESHCPDMALVVVAQKDGLINSQNWDGKVKSSRCKARKT